MSEWWTYRLSNFLLFSPRTYYRLFELYNAAIWPAQIAAAAIGLAILLAPAFAPNGTRSRLARGILAACWLWIAIAFHANRYATINWAAVYFAWAFGLEAALLLWTGVVRGRLVFERDAALARRAGFWIFVFALAVQPLDRPAPRPRMAPDRDLRRCPRPDGRRHSRHTSARDRPGPLAADRHPCDLVRDLRRDAPGHGGAGRLGPASGGNPRGIPGRQEESSSHGDLSCPSDPSPS